MSPPETPPRVTDPAPSPSPRSYQTLQEPRGPGDNDEELLHQFDDDGHLLAL